MSLTETLIQQLLNGLILGSFYSLVALGYTMVYGIIKLLNFAHGDLYMVGGFIGFALLLPFSSILGNGWLAIIPVMLLLISALAVSMILSNGIMVLTDGEYKPFNIDLGFGGIEMGNIYISYIQIMLVVTTSLLMIALHLFVKKTTYGKAMRAIAIDQDACRLMGINVNKIIAMTFFIGSALAAAAGIMAGIWAL